MSVEILVRGLLTFCSDKFNHAHLFTMNSSASGSELSLLARVGQSPGLRLQRVP